MTLKNLFPFFLFLFLLVFSACSSPVTLSPQGHETNQGSVAWTLPADQCPSLPAGLEVSGTGEHSSVTNTKLMANGSTKVVTNDLAKGSAIDSNGNTYHFIYQNHSTQVINGSVTQIEMKDSFILNGRGSATRLNVGFLWRWSFPTGEDPFFEFNNWEQLSTRGDPLHCDPL